MLGGTNRNRKNPITVKAIPNKQDKLDVYLIFLKSIFNSIIFP